MLLQLWSLEIHEEQVPMPATLMGTWRQSFSLSPSNTQLLSLNPLFLPGIKDVWQLPADTWRPSSRFSSR